MVVAERTSNLNSLLSSNKASLLTREQTPRPGTGINTVEYKLNQQTLSKHLCNTAMDFRVLSRVRMLYYLKQEIIGAEVDRIMEGTPYTEINISMCKTEGDPPTAW